MKLVGATAMSATAAGAVSGSAQASEDYKTIKVPAWKTHNISLGDNDTLENVLIDVTARGASVSIRAHGDGWAIRNVGIKGEIDVERPSKIFAPSVSKGGSAIVENFYMGDGCGISSPSRLGGIWVNANTPHLGELTFRRLHIAGWADNGLYGSGPGRQHGPNAGPVKVEQSYAHNNNIAGFRLGTHGSYVKDSTVVVDGDLAPVAMPGRKNGRGIWCKDGANINIENCDVWVGGPHGSSGIRASHEATAYVRDSAVRGGIDGPSKETNVTGNPSKRAPEGVPMTAEEAASGGSNTGSETPEDDQASSGLSNTLTISGEESPDMLNYEFTVAGELRKSTARGATMDDYDAIEDGTATGRVQRGLDSYEFEGELTLFRVTDGAVVYLNGERVNPAELGEDLANTLTIYGQDMDKDEYEFEVDGNLVQSDDLAATIDDNDVIEGGVARGQVRNYKDSYRFNGEILSFELDGTAKVILNGEEVDPDELGNTQPELPNVIILDGTATPDATSEYTFGVSGEINKTDELGTVDSTDTIEDGVATGSIGDDTDAYRFSGELTEFRLSGPASVTVKQGEN